MADRQNVARAPHRRQHAAKSAPRRLTNRHETATMIALVKLACELNEIAADAALTRLAVVGSIHEVVELHVAPVDMPAFFEDVDGALIRVGERLTDAFNQAVALELSVRPAPRRRRTKQSRA